MNKINAGENSQDAYETPDLNLASFLYCRKFILAGLKRLDARRSVFVFADSPELRQSIVEYVNDGVVPVRTFCSAVRDLKGVTR